MATPRERAGAARERLQERTARLAADRTLTAEAKVWAASKALAEARREVAEAAADHRRELEGQRRRLLERAFSPKIPSAASPMEQLGIRSAYRDALERAERLVDAKDAAALLERAALTGDRQQAQAVAATAFRKGWGGVLAAYGQAYPDEEGGAFAEVLRFSAETDSLESKFGVSVEFSRPPAPPMIKGLRDDQVETLAKLEEPPAAGELAPRAVR